MICHDIHYPTVTISDYHCTKFLISSGPRHPEGAAVHVDNVKYLVSQPKYNLSRRGLSGHHGVLEQSLGKQYEWPCNKSKNWTNNGWTIILVILLSSYCKMGPPEKLADKQVEPLSVEPFLRIPLYLISWVNSWSTEWLFKDTVQSEMLSLW